MYYSNFYKDMVESDVKKDIQSEGFSPIKYSDEPGFVYKTHKHPETKLLAFISGSMEVTVENELYECKPGDKLIIPGNLPHSAEVGSNGCVFFWSEKLL